MSFSCQSCHAKLNCRLHTDLDFLPPGGLDTSYGPCEDCGLTGPCVNCQAWPKKIDPVPAEIAGEDQTDTIPAPPPNDQEKDLIQAIETMTGRKILLTGRFGIRFDFQIRSGEWFSHTIESHGSRPERVVAIRDALRIARQSHDPPDLKQEP